MAEFFADDTADSWDRFLSEYDEEVAAPFQKHGIPKAMAILLLEINRLINIVSPEEEEWLE